MLRFWTQSKKQRILTIVIFLIFAILATAVGILAPLSQREINDKNSSLNATQQEIKGLDLPHRTIAIFYNNFLICLMMFIPVAGVAIGAIVLFNTGSYIAAQTLFENTSKGLNVPPLLVLLFLFIFPFTWFEFISYSMAFSESFWFIKRGLQGKWIRELINLGKLIAIAAILLFAGAFIEALLI
jgi:hypothetical protein